MTRIALKLLVGVALVAGVCVAAVGGISAGSGDLPAAPTAAAPPSAARPATDADTLVLDTKDWEPTGRIVPPKGRPVTSNKIP